MRDRNRRKLIIYGLLISLFVTTVAYAAISTTLDIVGNVSRKGSIWNIYFANLSEPELTGDASSAEARINSTTFNFGANLYQPGDSVTYTLDVKNGGTMDAKLSSISVQTPDNLEERNLEYLITYSDGTEIVSGDSLKSGDSKTINVVLKFKDSATSLPSTDTISNFSFTLIYVQDITEQTTPGGNVAPGITSNNVIAQIYGNSIQNGTPSPTNPVEIQSVGDKTNNLFAQDSTKTAMFSASSNTSVRSFEEGVWYLGLTYNNYFNKGNLLDYKFSENTTMVNVNNQKLYGLAQAFKVQPGQIYSLNYDDGENGRIDFGFYDANGNFLSYKTWQKSQTITIPSNAYWMTVCLSVKTASVEVTFSNLQLVLGDTITNYEPYGKYKIPIIINGNVKNLFNINNVSSNTHVVNNGDNTLSVTSSSTSSGVTAGKPYTLIDYAPDLQVGKTYVLSAESTGNAKRIYLSATKSMWYFGDSKTLTEEDLNSPVYWYANTTADTTFTATVSNIQIEEGETPTSYEPYINPVVNIYLDEPLRKVGDYADYVDLQTGKVVRRTGLLTDLNGLNWMAISNYFQAQLGFKVNANERSKTLSNLLPYGDVRINKSFWIDSSGTGIRIINSELADLNAFKEWIGGLDMYMLYPLAQPTTETISVPEFPELSGNITYSIGTTVQPSVVNYGTRN